MTNEVKKYRVTMYQTVVERTFLEVYATNEEEAANFAQERLCSGDSDPTWEYDRTEDGDCYEPEVDEA